ncbi:MAG: HD domain-containing protein [Pyrinomonadaceae bacterium]|nr:HD domain-containing protein [Phycisphaerales bacterium]
MPSSVSNRRFIRDLEPSERIAGAFAIANAQLGKTKQDKPFLKCMIGDRTGQLPGRMWSIDPMHFRRLPTDGFVYIEAETQPYQGELQLIIQNIDPVEITPELLQELLPTTDKSIPAMFAELTAILDTLEHGAVRALAAAYLGDEHLMSAFKQCPAAKSMHHAYLGGLLEHTLQLLRLGDRICPLYPKINRDVVLLGLFLHDLGKTRELVYDRTFGYSDRGELIGHIVDGAIMLHDKAQQAMRLAGQRMPQNLVMVLQHIILSHHTQPEYGAAKVPSTPEAILVALLDNLDAKTTIGLAIARPDMASSGELGGNFTEKQWSLDTKLFRPNPLE